MTITRRHVVLVAAAVLAVLVLGSVRSAPVAKADAVSDACGPAPDWWDAINWLQYQACAVQNGAAQATLTEITSPVLNDIKASVDGVAGPIVTAVGNVAGNVVAPVVGFFSPTTADFQPITDAITAATQRAPFSFVPVAVADIQSIQATMLDEANNAVGISIPSADLGLHVTSSTSGQNDFGVFAAGLGAWLWFLNQIGMSQQTVSLLFDAFIVLTTLWSMISEFGVRTGTLEPGAVPGPGEYVGESLSRLDGYRASFRSGRAGSSIRSRNAAYFRRNGL